MIPLGQGCTATFDARKFFNCAKRKFQSTQKIRLMIQNQIIF